MQTEFIGDGPYAEYAIADAVISVEGVAVDISAEALDDQRVIDICDDGSGGVVIGAGIGSAYVASIIIPSRKYIEQDTGEVDDGENPIYERIAVDLDINSVRLKLWPRKTG